MILRTLASGMTFRLPVITWPATLIGPGLAGKLRVKPYVTCLLCGLGTQLLSGRVLDSRPKVPRFKLLRRHCAVSFSKTQLSLLSTGSIQEDLSQYD